MNNFTIAFLAIGGWLALGVLFMSLCKAASRADRDMEEVAHALKQPRTLRQHVFAVRVRSLRSMRRLTGARGRSLRSAAARERVSDQGGLRNFHSA